MRTKATALLLAAMLAAAGCGSGDEPFAPPAAGGPDDGDGGNGGEVPGPGGTTVRIGSGTGGNFVPGIIGIGVTPLSAGGNSGLNLVFLDQDDNLVTEEITVTFSSLCIAEGLATVTSPVVTTTGIVQANYVAKGCDGEDLITATATGNDISGLQATGTIDVLPPTIGSIQFVSVTPETLSLRGMGGFGASETSTVVFRVFDTTGGVVPNQSVEFTLSTSVGGISLAPAIGVSNAAGEVQTVVQAGTVATPVRVNATIAGSSPSISSQSDLLTVSTGIPDADSVSLSVDTFNPEGYNWDGGTVTFTMRLADRFNNPVPDGTAVTFMTEGGSIAASCATDAGACTATWTSQNPRPAGIPAITVPPGNVIQAGQAGRAGVIGIVLGEESFVDVNGNGVFDDGDAFTDLGEPFIDENENGVYDLGETFFDSNSNGVRDPGDGFWNGALCEHSTLCGPAGQLIHISNQIPLVMAGSFITAEVMSPASVVGGAPYSVTGGEPLVIAFYDQNGQPPPFGTTIEVDTTAGAVQNGSETIRSTNVNGAYLLAFFFEGSTPADGLGNITIEITTPQANVFQRYFIQANDP